MAKSKKPVSEKYYSPFAKTIRELMEKNGTTQDELAEKVGKTRQTVSQYANGISEPGYDTLVKIAKHFEVSTDFLLGITDTKTPDSTAQAVIAYTGLTEENVLTLHHMKESSYGSVVSRSNDDESVTINGCKPYLDFLNDILDAIYSKKDTIIRDFILMQYYSGFIGNYDPLYYREDFEMGLQAHGHTSVPISTFIEHTSTKISREIEKYLIEKYTGTEKEGK